MSIVRFVGDAWVARVDEGSPEEDALRIADAIGAIARESAPDGIIYVGYDTRALSRGLAPEVAGVIAAHGLEVRLSEGHCPSSALSAAVRLDARAFGGVMLTADSRSADYFGLRVRMADGSPASPADTDVLEEQIGLVAPSSRGPYTRVDLVTPQLERISSFVGGESVRAASPLVVCDPMHGARVSHAARLLGSFGARVIELHGKDDPELGGLHPEVAEPWIDDCEQEVADRGAALGLAIDGSGDRVALVDERGSLVTPHLMLALIMEYLVRDRGMSGRMVAPIFVSTIVRRQAERLGMPLTVTPAGYYWMREEMSQGDVLCAGDALGGISVPAIGPDRDGLAAAALLLELACKDGRPLSQIVSDLDAKLGHMEYGRRDLRMGSGAVQVLRSVLPGINPHIIAGRRPSEVSHPGGLMARFDDGSWLLVRPSRSNSMARIYAEAPTPADRDALLDAASELALSPLN